MENILDMLTEKYDAWYDSEEGRPLYESELKCLKPRLEHAFTPVLEIGVGTGRFAMHFPNIIGVDPAENALKMAEKRGIKTVHAYGENLPFEDETFGCVLIIATLCFVEDPLKVLKEAKRVLKPDGSIIIGVIPKDSPWGTFYEEKKQQGSSFYSKARFNTFYDIKMMIEASGLIVAGIRSTLLQRPGEPRVIEEPVEGYFRDAGFLCIEAKRNKKKIV
ncbi:MAG TPA: class I SAM-dependent methyltransferase [Syntrophales bacterium]|nr:class I SAM-dependent methyltransferase [Syntrophales bacterium]